MNTDTTIKGTIYIAPGNSQCRVYAIPYRMRPGQGPADILPEYQRDWKLAAILDHKLDIVCLEPEFRHEKMNIEGNISGTFFEAEWAVA